MGLTIDQGAGAMGSVNSDGVYSVNDWPESTLTLLVGAPKSEFVDYVQSDGSIYVVSHYSLQTYMTMDAQSTLTRYPVLTSLSNLRALTITTAKGEQQYLITQEELLDADGNPQLDDDGFPLLTDAVYVNGTPVAYEAFEAAYNRLLMATVSGVLPAVWYTTELPHTTYTFHTKTGITHTIALTPFDALHDAVLVDGCAMFYIIRGGLGWGL